MRGPPEPSGGAPTTLAPTVTAALRQHVGPARTRLALPPATLRVLDWLCACQTSALGGRVHACQSCDWSSVVYNSCANRHCPQCSGVARARWLEDRTQQLLPVPHFQVVFTLPGVLRAIAVLNPALVYDLLFHASVDTLQQFAAQRFDARLGVLAVLHTWNKDLDLHPHVHLLVTAGGLRTDGAAWVASRRDYLFSKRALAEVVAARFVAGLRLAFDRGELRVPGPLEHARHELDRAIRTAYQRKWFVFIEPPQGRNVEQAAKYLARYVSGTAISNARVLEVTPTHVTFRGIQDRVVTLQGTEFVRRFAQHILPHRFRRIRYYGLYAPGLALTEWAAAWQLLDAPVPPEPPLVPPHTCPRCGGLVVVVTAPGLPFVPPRSPPHAGLPP